jgi:hypothetical protein
MAQHQHRCDRSQAPLPHSRWWRWPCHRRVDLMLRTIRHIPILVLILQVQAHHQEPLRGCAMCTHCGWRPRRWALRRGGRQWWRWRRRGRWRQHFAWSRRCAGVVARSLDSTLDSHGGQVGRRKVEGNEELGSCVRKTHKAEDIYNPRRGAVRQ